MKVNRYGATIGPNRQWIHMHGELGEITNLYVRLRRFVSSTLRPLFFVVTGLIVDVVAVILGRGSLPLVPEGRVGNELSWRTNNYS